MRAAVIGAGIAGLACARDLRAGGAEVVVFDKARRPGGRLSTRRADELRFDHGCPALAGGPWLDELPREAVSFGDFAGRVVPIPAMSALCRALAASLPVRCGVRVERVEPGAGGFVLSTGDGTDLGVFDRVAITAPAPQAAELLADAAPMLAEVAAGAEYSPCWAVMAAWDEPLDIGRDWHRDPKPGTPVAWAARESAKPGRGAGERWTIQAGPAWSAEHLEAAPARVARDLIAALGVTMLAGALPPPAFMTAHRWLYARVSTPLPHPCLIDAAAGIGAGGDWCAPMLEPREMEARQEGSGVPQALASGRALAAAFAQPFSAFASRTTT